MAKLVVSLLAQGDEAAIAVDLSEKAGIRIAAKYIAAFDRIYTRLVDHPQSGAPRPQIGNLVRIAIVAPYIVLHEYAVDTDTITILRIMHGRRKISGDMLRSNILDRTDEI